MLQAESLVWRGKSQEAVDLLKSQSTPPKDRNLFIEILALEGAANAHISHFKEADRVLEQADALCSGADIAVCGNVIRAKGVLAIERGSPDQAKQLFGESLSFARLHADPFLEATALLNLGLANLGEEHFDEAVDWTDTAYNASIALDFGDIAQTARGNLGWAYYNLGDADKSLEFSTEAVALAIRVGDVINQVSFLNNAGYVYAQRHDFARAKKSYIETLKLARGISNQRHIYNALRALALVSVESGELEEAGKYADEAIALARTNKDRLDELYPLLIKGLIAAQVKNGTDAERIFREVENDRHSIASLKWRAKHALARLYEDEVRSEPADREYRAALATFETARSSLHHTDSQLPFSANAFRIYDDYVHFLITHRRSDEALRWADYSRARTLAEGLGVLPKEVSEGPPPLDARNTARRVGGTALFYWLGEKQSYLWAVTARKTAVFTLAPAAQIEAAVQRYRKAIEGPGPDVLESADEDGRLLYRMLIEPAQSLLEKNAKVFILPDGKLNNLNFETLLVPEPKLHYWIEDVTIENASSLRLLDASVAGASGSLPGSGQVPDRSLLLIGNSLPPNDKYPPLPRAGAQMDAVAKHFSGVQKNILKGAEATPPAYLDGHPENFAYIHYVVHGISSQLSPLDSAIVLSKSSADSDSFKLYARDILKRPLRAELVTVAACYGAEGPSYSGEGLVGLSWAFLRAGAHHVIAALWAVTDAPAPQFMDEFYARIERRESPDVALRAAKLSLLHGGRYQHPFYWAPFQLYVGSYGSKNAVRARPD